MIRAALLPLLLLAGACAPRMTIAPAPVRTLAQEIDSIIDRPPLHRTSWGILVQDAATGAVIYEKNAGKLFIPASNTKLAVAVTAFGTLGPEWRYRTPFLASGRTGDTAALVLLQGKGDPTWSARVHGTVDAAIDSMAGLIASSGLRRIRLLGIDASRFTDDLVHSAWEVGDLPGQYAPPIDAVAAGEGLTEVVVRGGMAPGSPATAEVVGPLTQPLHVDVVTDTAGARRSIAIDMKARRDTVYLSGRIGAGAADTLTLAVTQPARSAGEALAVALGRRGVQVDSVRVVRDTAEARTLAYGATMLAEWVSPPISEIVSVIMRPSQNWVAEQVLKTLGAELNGDGSWRGGIAVERGFLYDVVGLDSGSVSLRDASGMSPQNLITPQAAVGMLQHAARQPWGAAFRTSLAAPGIAGSTLNTRLRPLQGRIAGKTGTISNVTSLSGYLTGTNGREIVFAILTNGSGLPSAPVRTAIDDIVLTIARHIEPLHP